MTFSMLLGSWKKSGAAEGAVGNGKIACKVTIRKDVAKEDLTSNGDVIRFSTARTTPSFVQTPMAVEPSCAEIQEGGRLQG